MATEPSLQEALAAYLEAQDNLDNRELHGPNADDYFALLGRRNRARADLEKAIAASTQAEPVATNRDLLRRCYVALQWCWHVSGKVQSSEEISKLLFDLIAAPSQAPEGAEAVELEQLKKDAARFKWLSDRFFGADFEWGEHQTPALLIGIGRASVVFGDLGLTVDSALSTQKEPGK